MSNDTLLSSMYPEHLEPWMYYFMAAFFLFSGIFGTVSNILVMVMLLKMKRYRKCVDCFLIFNLGVADVCMSAVCLPFLATSNISQDWVFGDIGCQIYGFLVFVFGLVALFTFCAISIERYVVLFINPKMYFRTKTGIAVTVGVWTTAILWSCLPFVIGNGFAQERFLTSCSINWAGRELKDRIFNLASVLLFGMCFVIMVICYVSIIKASKKTISAKHNRTILRVCFSQMILYFVCWSPYAAFSLWFSYADAHDSTPLWATAIPLMFTKVYSCYNTVIYFVVSRRFRKRYSVVLRCCKVNRIRPTPTVKIHTIA